MKNGLYLVRKSVLYCNCAKANANYYGLEIIDVGSRQINYHRTTPIGPANRNIDL